MDTGSVPNQAAHRSRMMNSPVKAAVLYAISRGVPVASIEAATGVSSEVLFGPDPWLPQTVMPTVWTLLVAHVPDEPVTLQFAEASSLDFYGPMGSIMPMIPTIGDSVRLQVRFGSMFSDQLDIALVEDGDEAALRYIHQMDPLDGGCAAEAAAAIGVHILRNVLDGGPALLRVEFAHPPRWSVDTYLNHFRVPVRFNQPKHAVVYRRSALGWPVPTGDPQMLPFIQRYLENERRRMGARGDAGAIARVIEAIVANAEVGRFDAKSAARRLGVSLRSLQRTTKEHDTSMRDLIQQVRVAIAKRALADPQRSVAEVAARSGYADERSFRRAFQSWTGMTPAHLRKTFA